MSQAARERDFWDHEIPTVEQVLREFETGPCGNDLAMLEAVQAAPGRRIFDLACGAGLTACWLAARGATVTAADISPVSVEVGQQVADRLGLAIEWLVTDITTADMGRPAAYDGVTGRYALHHMDCSIVGPAVAALLRPGGTAAFVETMASNPLLRVARAQLTGRYGIPRYGTLDERPLRETDLDHLRRAFATVEVTAPDYDFLRLLDRQILRYRWPTWSKQLRRGDSLLSRVGPLQTWSYHQVVVCRI